MEVSVTGRSHDGGIDGIVEIPLLGIKVAVQAKRWANQMVGVDLVQRLMGSVQSGRCDRGVFVTTTGFTAGAREVAEDGANRVALIDGEALVKLLVDKGVGIKEKPVVTQELGEDFFQSLRRP
jgi:restriction system protein